MSPTASAVSFGPWSSPRRCTARTMRSPLSVTIPGNTASPTSPDRGGMTTSARPDARLKSVSATSPARDLRPEGEDLVAVEPRGGFGVAAHDEDVALGDRGAARATRLGRRSRCRPGSDRGTPSGRPRPAGRRRTAIPPEPGAGTARRGAGTARRGSGRGCSDRAAVTGCSDRGSRRRPNSTMIAMRPEEERDPDLWRTRSSRMAPGRRLPRRRTRARSRACR